MTRRWLSWLAGTLVLTAGMILAADGPLPDDDQPVRLKKKKRPDRVNPGKDDPDKKPADPDKKPDEKKDDKKADDMPGEITRDGEPVTPDEEDKEVFERIAKNMKSSEDRLANKELDESTRQIQEDIIKDLDSLIKSA